jgi:RNA polymerase sigma-70 factor (ECF subfamily)
MAMENGADSYRRYLEGDDGGVVELVRTYQAGLILFLNRYVHNIEVAEELAEDTFVRLVTKKPRYVPTHSFKTWLYTIARNLALNYLKHEGRHAVATPEELERLAKAEESLEQVYLREERQILVHQALSKLRPDYATVLYLKFFEELSNEQIAHVCGKRKRQVENLLYQAKQSLKVQLEQEGFSDERL